MFLALGLAFIGWSGLFWLGQWIAAMASAGHWAPAAALGGGALAVVGLVLLRSAR